MQNPRLSTMGLMNIGASEGSQIIPLIGRGVRLKGYGFSLKRSGRASLPEGVTRPRHISLQKTLNIFGIKADYMAQFKAFLEEEGLPQDDPNLPPGNDEHPEGCYRVLVEQSQAEIVANIEKLNAAIKSGKLKPWEFRGMKALGFDRHLYEPLLHLKDKIVRSAPCR